PRVIVSPADVLLLALWFSLLTALAQLAMLGVRKSLGQVVSHSAEVAWMAPLAYLLAFAPIALLLAMAAWIRPRIVSLRVACFVFAFLVFVSLALGFRGLAAFAAPLLAVGLAVDMSRQLVARAAGFLRLVKRTLGLAAALSIVAAIGVPLWQQRADARATP